MILNYLGENREAMRIVIKVGTNVLTRQNQRLDFNLISDLVEQISVLKQRDGHEILLVSSGAVGAGREKFDFQLEKDPLIKKQVLASIGQGRLFQVYSDFFIEQGIITAQALLTRSDFQSKISYRNIKSAFDGLLSSGIVPIINENDVVSVQATGFGDNDQLAALAAALMEVDLLIILTDIYGLYTADPKKDKEAKLIEKVEQITPELETFCGSTLSSGGTGGMYSKLKAAQIATEHGIPTVVTCGKEEACLLKVMEGKAKATEFLARKKKKLNTRGTWMNTGAHITGSLSIDSGAVSALLNNKSLLAVGVHSMEGDFQKGDVLLIKDLNGIRIGAGLAKLDSESLQTLIQEQNTRGVIVVHKNNLYTL